MAPEEHCLAPEWEYLKKIQKLSLDLTQEDFGENLVLEVDLKV